MLYWLDQCYHTHAKPSHELSIYLPSDQMNKYQCYYSLKAHKGVECFYLTTYQLEGFLDPLSLISE